MKPWLKILTFFLPRALCSFSILISAEFSLKEIQKCSPQLRLLLNRGISQLRHYQDVYEVEVDPEQAVYHILLKLKPGSLLSSIPGVEIQATIGPIATARATREGVLHLAKLAEVERLDISKFMQPCLDVSRISTEVDHLYSGNPFSAVPVPPGMVVKNQKLPRRGRELLPRFPGIANPKLQESSKMAFKF